jgi:hypothetical protein
VIIEEGLIAIGILALVAAIFMLRGKGKTSHSVHKPVVSEQVGVLAGPSVPPEALPGSADNEQTTTVLAELTVLTDTQVPFSMPAADKQEVTLAESSHTTELLTQVAFPVQATTVVAQTPVWTVQSSQTQVAVALDEQLTAKSGQGLPEVRTQSGIPSGVAPLPPLKQGSGLLPNSLSIDQQMAELIAEVWTLQQQVAEIGGRLNSLSTCIRRSLVSASDEPEANGREKN